jgi:hypothetical protein
VGDPPWLAVSVAKRRAGMSRQVDRTGSPSYLRAYHQYERPPELTPEIKITFKP